VPGRGVPRTRAIAALWALCVLTALLFGAQAVAGHDAAGASVAAVGSGGSGGPVLPGGPAGGSGGSAVSGGSGGGSAADGGAAAGAANIGPAQINAIGRPDMCWQASGNGAPITLETCDSAIQNQQWTLTSDGVLMNGIGYCLEARAGQPAGVPLYIDFAGQCGGGGGQDWRFGAATGRLTSSGICATAGGPLVPGTEIVRSGCPAADGHTGRAQRWSLGFSAVSLAAGQGSGPTGGSYAAYVTVANAASAQAAYGTAVRFRLPHGLTATGLRGTGGAAGLRCRVAALTCSGTLPAGASGRIDVAGRVPAGAVEGDGYPLSARVSVAGTSQLPGQARTAASVTVSVLPAVTSAGGGALAGGSPGPSPVVPLIAILAGVLVVGGGLLVGVAKLSKALRPATGLDTPPMGGRRRPGARRRGRAG